MKRFLKFAFIICLLLISTSKLFAQYATAIEGEQGGYVRVNDSLVEVHIKNVIPRYTVATCFSKNTVLFIDVDYSSVHWAIDDYRKASKKEKHDIIKNYKNKGLLVSHSTGERLGVMHSSGPFELSLYFKVSLKDWKSLYIVDISQYETHAYYIYKKNPKYTTNFDNVNIYKYIDANYDGIVGVYSYNTDDKTSHKKRWGIIKTDSCYYQVQLKYEHVWPVGHIRTGEITGKFTPYDESQNIFIYQDRERRSLENEWNSTKYFCHFSEKGYVQHQNLDQLSTSTNICIRQYPENSTPTISPKKEAENCWTGSAFALNDGYIITNYHVIKEATDVKVHGVKGDVHKGYEAQVIVVDKNNDLALLKIIDKGYTGVPNPPYAIQTKIEDVGESIWTLGYPLTDIMGTEIKYTEGTISAKSGIQGDVTVYQITAPIQPGNSGGPLFNSKGDIIGITSSGLNRRINAENVNYAIKTSYLKILIDSTNEDNIIPSASRMEGMNNVDMIKTAKNYVYYLVCR